MVFETNGIPNAEEKLIKALEIVTRTIKEDSSFSHINEVLLSNIVVNEYSKSYLVKEVDEENKNGYFIIYKRLVKRIQEMIHAVNPEYAFPKSLASTVLEGALHQHFLKEHFKSITDCDENVSPTKYFTELVIKLLK